MFELYSDVSTSYLSGIKTFHTHLDSMTFLQQLLNNKNVQAYVIENESGERVTTISLLLQSFLNTRSFEIGYATLPKFRSKGMTKRALNIMIEDIQRRSRTTFLVAKYLKENESSKVMLRKLNFKEYGSIRIIDIYGFPKDGKLAYLKLF